MFSLLFLASIVLPSVIGQCCLPEKMSAIIFDADSRNPNDFLIDFNRNKFVYRPWDHSHVDFVLYDMNMHKYFLMNHNGGCSIHEMDESSRNYVQCLPEEAKKNSGFLGPINGMAVDYYQLEHKGVTDYIAVTDDGCVPVITFASVPGVPVNVHFWGNVTTDVTDLSPLDVDVSHCIEEPEIAG